MNSHEVFIHIHQGCFAGTGAIVRLPQCQWSKPDGYGKISQCITTTKHSNAKTVCIFHGIYCRTLIRLTDVNEVILVNMGVDHCLASHNETQETTDRFIGMQDVNEQNYRCRISLSNKPGNWIYVCRVAVLCKSNIWLLQIFSLYFHTEQISLLITRIHKQLVITTKRNTTSILYGIYNFLCGIAYPLKWPCS